MRLLLNLESNGENTNVSTSTTDSQTVTPTFGSLASFYPKSETYPAKNVKSKAIRKEKEVEINKTFRSKISPMGQGLTSSKRLITFGANSRLT